MTLIGAMSIPGVVAKKAQKGSMKGKDFKEFVEKELVDKLNPGAVSGAFRYLLLCSCPKGLGTQEISPRPSGQEHAPDAGCGGHG